MGERGDRKAVGEGVSTNRDGIRRSGKSKANLKWQI
jgi:hypothetical protein